MTKALWQMSLEELDHEIAVTQSILDSSGYFKIVADHLACLQERREERLIEKQILEGSRFVQEVLQPPQGMVET